MTTRSQLASGASTAPTFLPGDDRALEPPRSLDLLHSALDVARFRVRNSHVKRAVAEGGS